MRQADLIALRLQNQCISTHNLTTPEDIVRWFGAIQSQDFISAKWAIGLRSAHLTDTVIEQAYNQGRILRTHLMRPTWHFILPEDIRWLLLLTNKRIHQLNKHYYHKFGLDEVTLQKWTSYIAKLLRDSKDMTREELVRQLKHAYSITKNTSITVTFVLMYAELEGIICSGPRRGKQFTYTLLDERIPKTNSFDRETALAELTLRYFQSHGPATLQDFVWWSGLRTSDARLGITLHDKLLHKERVEDREYFFIDTPATQKTTALYLLPNYDEYIVGYTNRDSIFDSNHLAKLDARANPLFQHTIVYKGEVIGTWKREYKKKSIILQTNLFISIPPEVKELLKQAINRFSLYANTPISQ